MARSLAGMNIELLRALGIDPTDPVRAVTIRIEVGCIPVIEVERFALDADTDELAEIVQKCHLVPVADATYLVGERGPEIGELV